MRARARGGIMNLASLAAFTPGPWQAPSMGRRVVVPGIVNSFIAWSARAMPFELLLPLVSWLMKPRVRRVTETASGARMQKLSRKLLPR
jgi:hypothetical protein